MSLHDRQKTATANHRRIRRLRKHAPEPMPLCGRDPLVTNAQHKSCFISRPRRFGKPLMLSPLKAIFQNGRERFWETDFDWPDYGRESHSYVTWTHRNGTTNLRNDNPSAKESKGRPGWWLVFPQAFPKARSAQGRHQPPLNDS